MMSLSPVQATPPPPVSEQEDPEGVAVDTEELRSIEGQNGGKHMFGTKASKFTWEGLSQNTGLAEHMMSSFLKPEEQTDARPTFLFKSIRM